LTRHRSRAYRRLGRPPRGGKTGQRNFYIFKDYSLAAKPGFSFGNQVLQTRRVRNSGPSPGNGVWISIAQKNDFFRPGGEGGHISFGIGKGTGNIGPGLQGVLKKHTANDGFHITPAFDTAGNIQPRRIRKRNQMKSIANPQEFLQESPGHIIIYFPVETAHAG
jgi:hypothetical protein